MRSQFVHWYASLSSLSIVYLWRTTKLVYDFTNKFFAIRISGMLITRHAISETSFTASFLCNLHHHTILSSPSYLSHFYTTKLFETISVSHRTGFFLSRPGMTPSLQTNTHDWRLKKSHAIGIRPNTIALNSNIKYSTDDFCETASFVQQLTQL